MAAVFQIPKRPLAVLTVVCCAAACLSAFAAEVRTAEHVTLTNGFDLICDHREQAGDRVRLYTEAGSSNFVEVKAAEVASVEKVLLPTTGEEKPAGAKASAASDRADLTRAELHELLSSAGARHNLDVHLLESVVRAESGGRSSAVSKKGAQGLMQLMPKTAAQLGVADSLRPEDNVAGGASYLDGLLTRYHDKLALALAAYNAGPAAVDRCLCVPPYRETRLYVARIIRDFNSSVKAAARDAEAQAKLVEAVASNPRVPMTTAVAQSNPAQRVLTGATAP